MGKDIIVFLENFCFFLVYFLPNLREITIFAANNQIKAKAAYFDFE